MSTEQTSLSQFISFIEKYKDEGGYIGVLMNLPDHPHPELIVNLPENLITKTNYYSKAYNPDLTLKTNNQVRILKYTWVTDFEMLENLFEKEEM